jgi:hypothetical protein
MVASLVNVDNSHPGNFMSSNQGAVRGYGGKIIGPNGKCLGIKHYGGSKRRYKNILKEKQKNIERNQKNELIKKNIEKVKRVVQHANPIIPSKD